MGEVIKVNFSDKKENSGYVIDERKIKGVYQGDMVAYNDGEICQIGCRGDSEIYNPIEISFKDLNQFCIMWLCIFDPDVIKEDENSNK